MEKVITLLMMRSSYSEFF